MKRLLLSVLLLSGCAASSKPDHTKIELKQDRFEINYTSQSSRLRIEYRNLRTGDVITSFSSRCPSYKNIDIGNVYKLDYSISSYYRRGNLMEVASTYPSACTIATNLSPIAYPEVK